jgi:hypothetical protein
MWTLRTAFASCLQTTGSCTTTVSATMVSLLPAATVLSAWSSSKGDLKRTRLGGAKLYRRGFLPSFLTCVPRLSSSDLSSFSPDHEVNVAARAFVLPRNLRALTSTTTKHRITTRDVIGKHALHRIYGGLPESPG